MLLAIDTSTSQASIALVRMPLGAPAEPRDGASQDSAGQRTMGDDLLAEVTWNVGQHHSAELLPRLRWLLDATGVASSQITLIAVALGPGSFNGVRVALAAAKALAFALGARLIGVPTLDVVAWGAHLAEGPLWAVLEAGRGQIYAATYPSPQISAADWVPRGETSILTPEKLAERAATEEAALATGHVLTLCGEWHEATRDAISAALAARGLAARFDARLGGRRASWLATLALARATQGQYDEAMSVEPLYLRRPAITQPGAGKRTRQPEHASEHASADGNSESTQLSAPDTKPQARVDVHRKPGAAEAKHGDRDVRHAQGERDQRGGREAPEATDGEESSHALHS